MADQRTQAGEASVPRTRNPNPEAEPLLSPRSHEDGSHPEGERKTPRRIILISFLFVVTVDFASFFMDVPQTNILEQVICSRYYASRSSSASDCSVAPVQSELATVTQLLNTTNLLPGLLVAIPFGLLADRWGRRPVLVMSMLGMFAQNLASIFLLWNGSIFPPRLMWLTSALRLLGGGDVVATSMVFLVVADITPAAERANLFFRLSACILIGDIVATPLSAFLMARSPWIPYLLSTVLTGLGITIPAFLLPETLGYKGGQAPERATVAASGTGEENRQGDTSQKSQLLARLRVLAKADVIAICLAFLVAALGRQSTSFLVQYVRHRFNWTYSKASLLIALRGSANLALLLVFLPLLNHHLGRIGLSVAAKDLFVSRASVALLAVGSVVVALAPTVVLVATGVVLLALGSGFGPASRSLVTSLVHHDEAGTLYSALGLMQSIGGLMAGPILASSFEWGLSRGPEWTGVPFLLVAGLFGLGLLAMACVQLESENEGFEEQ